MRQVLDGQRVSNLCISGTLADGGATEGTSKGTDERPSPPVNRRGRGHLRNRLEAGLSELDDDKVYDRVCDSGVNIILRLVRVTSGATSVSFVHQPCLRPASISFFDHILSRKI